jgi:hypothetical protein
MSKVELQYELSGPLDEELMERIARAHSIYGLLMVRPNPAMDSLTLQYDASRLTPLEVEAALRRAGIAGKLHPAVLA